MKKILGYLGDYFQAWRNYRYLAALLLFTAAAIYLNFFIRSEDAWIKADPNAARRLLKYLAEYALMFGGAYALMLPFDKDRSLRSGKLWALVAFAVLLFAIRAWASPDWQILAHMVPGAYLTLVWKLIVNGTGFVVMFIPCAAYWFIIDRKREPLYGFHAKGVVLWPYFVLIALTLPLLFAAGTQADFQSVYPRGARLSLPPGVPYRHACIAAYEAVYSFDYVVTEFFFRGFLILPFARIAGPKVILPMCAFYVSIHFDKPLGECISSFFGGWILGILAWRTRSIYGGVIVHLGIALAMEIIGWMM